MSGRVVGGRWQVVGCSALPPTTHHLSPAACSEGNSQREIRQRFLAGDEVATTSTCGVWPGRESASAKATTARIEARKTGGPRRTAAALRLTLETCYGQGRSDRPLGATWHFSGRPRALASVRRNTRRTTSAFRTLGIRQLSAGQRRLAGDLTRHALQLRVGSALLEPSLHALQRLVGRKPTIYKAADHEDSQENGPTGLTWPVPRPPCHPRPCASLQRQRRFPRRSRDVHAPAPAPHRRAPYAGSVRRSSARCLQASHRERRT